MNNDGDKEEEEEIILEQESATHKKKKKKKTGLGSALMNPETLKRIVKAGGDARAKDIESLRAAGKLGGTVVKETYGISHYKTMGVKGGGTTLERYSVEYYRTIGKQNQKNSKKGGKGTKK